MVIRETLHCVFLKYAKSVGLNLGILNVHKQLSYNSLSPEIKKVCESLVMNTNRVSIEEVLTIFRSTSPQHNSLQQKDVWRKWDLWSKLTHSIIAGIDGRSFEGNWWSIDGRYDYCQQTFLNRENVLTTSCKIS